MDASQMGPWLASYHRTNDAHYTGGGRRSRRRDYDSDSSSRSSHGSHTSSSYTDKSERTSGGSDDGGGGGGGSDDGSARYRRGRRVKFDAIPNSISNDTKFDNIMKQVQSVLDKPLYRIDGTKLGEEDANQTPMFYCPNCKTKQRDFINFATASGVYDSPQTMLGAGFALYLVASLFVFGLVEGWRPLDW